MWEIWAAWGAWSASTVHAGWVGSGGDEDGEVKGGAAEAGYSASGAKRERAHPQAVLAESRLVSNTEICYLHILPNVCMVIILYEALDAGLSNAILHTGRYSEPGCNLLHCELADCTCISTGLNSLESTGRALAGGPN